jgi:hypothetical protein
MSTDRFWRVLRHGGRASDDWREVVRTNVEQMARNRFASERERMRQGGVQLLAPLGTVVDSAWAPRLRTRW